MRDLIDLSSGQVVEAMPDAAIKALADVVSKEQITCYAPIYGEPALRAAVAGHYANRGGTDSDLDDITITAGARHGLFCATAVVARGGEVLVPQPHWSHYPEVMRLAGAHPVFVPGLPATGLLVDPDLLEAARTPATKAVIVNSPVNPTGAVYDSSTMAAIRDWARRLGVRLIVDDIYWAYGDEGAAGPQANEHEVVVGGAAKVHALAGVRVGWVWADPAVTAAVRGVVEHTTGPVSTLAQAAVTAVLDNDSGMPDRVRRVTRQRVHAIRAMADVPLLRVVRPRGGIYLCLDASALAAVQPQWRDDRLLCAVLAEQAGVRLRAGSTFGLPGHLRMCVAVPPDVLSEAARRLAVFVRAAKTTTDIKSD
ncbi:pyridoxal phosphate-dependent aminotransferase [Nocardia sp. NPDC051052]|uniref:pyridoxal phosphate-dependent aminotransferase n=1 Tax=Nocardia sp. NPDC051052 TaxID=3364322 RepID=UPI0037A29201